MMDGKRVRLDPEADDDIRAAVTGLASVETGDGAYHRLTLIREVYDAVREWGERLALSAPPASG